MHPMAPAVMGPPPLPPPLPSHLPPPFPPFPAIPPPPAVLPSPIGAAPLFRQPRPLPLPSLGSGASNAGPAVRVNGLDILQQMAAYLKQPLTGEVGYRAVYTLYGQIRASLKRDAFHGSEGAEVAIIQAQMVVWQGGRKKPTNVAVRRINTI